MDSCVSGYRIMDSVISKISFFSKSIYRVVNPLFIVNMTAMQRWTSQQNCFIIQSLTLDVGELTLEGIL